MGTSLHIRADADPQTLPRILGLLSQRWLVPSLFSARLDGQMLDVHCVVPELAEPAAAIVAAKLEQIVLVHAVHVLSAGERPNPAGAADRLPPLEACRPVPIER